MRISSIQFGQHMVLGIMVLVALSSIEGSDKPAQVRRGGGGGMESGPPPPEKSQKYRVS